MTKWIHQNLRAGGMINYIPSNSIIVMDNAPYHNQVHEKCPTKSSLKREMVAWLEKKGIPFDPTSIKSMLPKWLFQFAKLHFMPLQFQ